MTVHIFGSCSQGTFQAYRSWRRAISVNYRGSCRYRG